MKENIKNHLLSVKKITHIYLLGVALSWAAFPILIVVSIQFVPMYVSQSIFSAIATIILTCMIYITMHEVGMNDRKPYKWARYKWKGFVCGFAFGVMLWIVELIVIMLANKHLTVTHPFFMIKSLNSYATLILYMPFFWFYRLIGNWDVVNFVPWVDSISAGALVVYFTLVCGISYLMGYNGRKIIKKEIKNDALRRILYSKSKKKGQE